MASAVYNDYKSRMLGLGTMVDLDGDQIDLSLHTSSYTPDIDADQLFSDVDNEISSTGSYTAGAAGGGTLTVTLTQDDTDDEGVFDATDVSFTNATITARYAVLRKNVSDTAASSPVILYIDFGSDQNSSAGTFTIAFAAEGILNIS